MKYRVIIIISVILILSGCVDTVPELKQVTPEEVNNMKLIGSFDEIDLYQFRLESINATCIGGTRGFGAGRVAVFDCKYD